MMKNNIPIEITDAFDQYINEMTKFRQLLVSSQEYLIEVSDPDIEGIPYLEISIVSLFLRQAIELLIFSSLLIDKRRYILQKKCKNWNIKNVISGIEKINTDWFPKSIELISTDEEIKEPLINIYKKLKNCFFEDKKSVVKKDDIIEYYNYLSDFIHYENILKENKKEWESKDYINTILMNLKKVLSNLMELTSSFAIKISDTNYVFYININNKEVNGTIFSKNKKINQK